MDKPEDTAGMGLLNLGTSTLLTASNDVVPKASNSTRYNLLDQLLSSDSDSDTRGTESKPALASATGVLFAVEKPEHSSTEEDMHSTGGSPEPEQRKSPVKMSAVARLAAARRKKAQASSVGGGGGGALSSSDSDDSDVSPTSKRHVSSFTSMRISADSDSEPDLTTTGSVEANSEAVEEAAKEKKKRRQPRAKDGNTVRAASKKAMAMIHEESARLIRETAVAINPMDYTQPLELHDFFAKFDTMVAQRTQGVRRTRNIAAALAKTSIRTGTSIVQCDSDGDDYDLEIDDCYATPVPNNPTTRRMLAVPKTPRQLRDGVPESKGGELESILKYGSQPIHLTAGQSGELHGMRRTDGSRALRDLNHALLGAMYSSQKDAPKPGKLIGARAGNAEEVDVAMDDDGTDGDQDSSDESEGESSDDDAVMDEAKSPGVVMPRKNRAVVVSDDDDETSAANQPTPETEDALAKPVVAAAVSKTKFLSMFKMPAAKPPPPPLPRTTEPEPPREPQQLSYPMTSEQDESITGSQDPLNLLSSQVDQLNTQDSLLMTPDPLPDSIDDIMGFGTQLAIDAHVFGSQQSQADTVDRAVENESTQSTQPTQPTQLTAADGGDALSSLPTLVRKALFYGQGGGAEHVDDVSISGTPLPADISASISIDIPADMPANVPDDVQRLSDMSDHEEAVEATSSLPKATSGGRRFLRRHNHHDRNKKSKLSKTKKQAIRTEFVEAEAEEGESSDSDNESGVRHGKFNWGDAPPTSKPDDDDDDDELDMDTDEEEAALLADPMINNDVAEDRKADQAIRDLHRQQDLDQDEQDIQDLVKDINTGRLRNRTNGSRTGFALAEEDYIDRQTRAERMEERLRQRRKLQAREIHDTNLAEIAKNPETAAFAQAALMRPTTTHRYQSGNDTDDDGFLSGNEAYDLEERVDDHVIASTVQTHLSRTLRRVDSDAESDSEGGVVGGGKGSAGGEGSRIRRGRIVGPAKNSADESQQSAASSLFFDVGDEDGDLFTSVAVEKLIVRRKTLMAGASSGADASANGARQSGVWPVLKRPGMPLTGANTKRANASNGAVGNKL